MNKQSDKITLDSLFNDFDYKAYWEDWENKHPNELKEVNWGKPVGKEIL